MPRAIRTVTAAAALALGFAGAAQAATCGNTSSGYQAWKQEFAAEAQQAGVGQRGIDALMGAQYSGTTISADRNQTGVRYSLDEFIRIRLGSVDGFAATARKRIQQNPQFYSSLEQRYGVPAGILVAIHGMETGFGRTMGNVPVISSITTVAYDCRRSDFFTPHALAALQMVDRGMLSANQQGAAHGELGHTQFLPGNAMRYGVDGNGDGRVDFYNQYDVLVRRMAILTSQPHTAPTRRPARWRRQGLRGFGSPRRRRGRW